MMLEYAEARGAVGKGRSVVVATNEQTGWSMRQAGEEPCCQMIWGKRAILKQLWWERILFIGIFG